MFEWYLSFQDRGQSIVNQKDHMIYSFHRNLEYVNQMDRICGEQTINNLTINRNP